MSLAKEYFFRDNQSGADPAALPGDDSKDGLSDENAKRSYPHLLSLINNAEAGTIFNLADDCGFSQAATFRFNNLRPGTVVVSLDFDGEHVTCVTEKASNITVGQETTIKGAAEEHFNGLVTCAEVISPATFKYLPVHDCSTPGPATIDEFSDKLYCDAGAIKVTNYISNQFDSVFGNQPSCEYSDSSHAQHRIDRGPLQGLSFSNIDYRYTGSKSGSPNCFFVYNGDKESLYFENLTIDGYRIGGDFNNREGTIKDVTVTNCIIKNCWIQGVLGGPDYSLFYDNVFDNNGHNNTGGGNNKYHNIYLSNCHHTIVRKNECSKSAIKNGIAQGTEIVFHGVCSKLIIDDNYIHNEIGESHGGNYGIAVNSGYNSAEHFTDCIIRNNKIVNTGNKSIDCSAWVRGVVEDNEIISEQNYGHMGIVFEASRNVEGTPTSDGFSILNNIISGSSVVKDIDVQAGTNYTIVRPDDTPPVDPDPPEPEPGCDVEITTTVQVKVNGDITKTSEYITKG